MYTDTWAVTVNISKTKIVIFKNTGNMRTECTRLYNDEIIDMVDSFRYLRILMNFNGKHYITQKQLAAQSRKEFFALK